MGAREKLAAIRGATSDVRVRTPLLDRAGLTSAEVKRRAAAGEVLDPERVEVTVPEAKRALMIDAATGFGEGVLGAAALGMDATVDLVKGPLSVWEKVQRLRRGESLPSLLAGPFTSAVSRDAERARQFVREKSGVSHVDTGVPGAVVRMAADIIAPGPEAAAIGRAGAKAARVTEELVDDAAKLADDVPITPSVPDEEIARLTEQAGRAQEAARIDAARPPEPSPSTLSPSEVQDRMIQMELDNRASGVGSEVGTMHDDLIARGKTPPSPPDASGGAIGPDGLPKYASPSAINLERLEAPAEAKQFIADTAKAVDDPLGGNIAADLEAIKGEPLTHAEIQAAKGRAAILTRPATREMTERYAAELLRSRDELVEMAKTGRVTPEYLELQRAVSTEATHLGRMLNSLGIKAGDDVAATAIREVTEQLEAAGKTADEIVQALEGVDFADPQQAAQAYAKVVKPKWGDLLEAYRYTNLLSSPRTHIVNLTSNLIQAGVTRPLDLMASGTVDWFGSKLTGRARTRYASDVAPYYRGMMSAYPKAVGAFMDAMKGKVPVGQLDLAQTAARSNVPTALQIVPRLLDGMDRFTVALIEGGEFERLASIAKKGGKQFNEVEAATNAMATAKEYAFRKVLDPDNASGHGALLSTIDTFTSRVSHVLNTRVGGVQPLRWAVPFIQTPMNIFKSGIEHSPLGLATLYKSTRKTEQLGKAITGSAVFMGAGMLAMDDRTTWAAPRDAKGRAAFYAAGLQPYSVKVGDKWISYTKLGPLAYPIALAAAMKHQAVDHPNATGNMDVALAGRIVGSLAEFFSDQSYMQGIGDLVNAAKGDESVMARFVSNVASQFVPLSSLQRWITQIIDPIYRKSSRELSFEGIMQNLKRNIPGLSGDVPQQTPKSERQFPIVNAVSPFGITEEKPKEAERFRGLMRRRRNAAIRKRAQAE